MPTDNLKLIQRTIAGDKQSYEDLMRECYPKFHALANSILKDSAEAQDIVQHALITIWQKKGELKEAKAFPAWSNRIVRNKCYDELRKKNKPIPTDDDTATFKELEDTDQDTIPAVYTEREDLKKRLGEVIESLSSLQRQTLVMCYFEDMSIEEIAEATDSSTNTVKQRLFQARKSIKEKIISEEERTGEKFYGVSGIALASLGEALVPQFASGALNAVAIGEAVATVSSTISASTTTSAVAAGTATAAKTTMPLVAKVLIGALAAVVVVGGGVAGVMAALNTPEVPAPIEEEVVLPVEEEEEVVEEEVGTASDSLAVYQATLDNYKGLDALAADVQEGAVSGEFAWDDFIGENPSADEQNLQTMFGMMASQSAPYGDPGYMIIDLNDDGVDELILLQTCDEYIWSTSTFVLGIMTIIDGKPLRLIEFWDRNPCQGISKSGIIAVRGSGGWAVQSNGFYEISSSGDALEVVESYSTDNIRNPEVVDYFDSDMNPISEAEYYALLEAAFEKYLGNGAALEIVPIPL